MVRWCHSKHQSFRWIILRGNHMSPRPLLPCFNLGASLGTQVPYPWSKMKGTISSNSKSLNHSSFEFQTTFGFQGMHIMKYRDNTNLNTRKNTYKHRWSIPKTTIPSTIPYWPQHWQTLWALMQKVQSASPMPAVRPNPRWWHVPRLPEVKCNKPGVFCICDCSMLAESEAKHNITLRWWWNNGDFYYGFLKR